VSEKAEKKTPADVESLLRQRDELDRAIREKYQRRVAVIFTDIQGSTQYFERFGDLAGRAMVQRHNDLLFPVIANTGGRVVKTIGDAIMAFFENSRSAVDAAIKMQKVLDEKNEQWPERERINVRIGVHVGEALVDSADVYGDTVNTAARIEAQANGGEILISDAVLAELGPSAPQVRARGAVKLKGKAHEVPLYEVRWRDREPLASVVSGGKSTKKLVLAAVGALVLVGSAGTLFVTQHGHFGKKLIPTVPAKATVATPAPPVQHKSAPAPVSPPAAPAKPEVSAEVQDVGTIALNVDTQKVIKIAGVTRAAIGDPRVVEVREIASDQLLVIGRAPGKSVLGVTAAGGQRLTYMVVVHPGERHEPPERTSKHEESKAEAGATGTLHLHVFPWGDLTVDGKLVRSGARDAELRLSAGAHDVRIHNPGFPDKVKRFEVVAGKTIDEDISLAPGG
jgi:class 3 adenylate cyclase